MYTLCIPYSRKFLLVKIFAQILITLLKIFGVLIFEFLSYFKPHPWDTRWANSNFRVIAYASFTIQAMIRCYHIYRDIWSAVRDQESPCEKKLGNLTDPFTVGAGSNFCTPCTCSKYVKICTIQKFPAIW